MSFLPLYLSLKKEGILPVVRIEKGAKTYEFYGTGLRARYCDSTGEIIAHCEKGRHVKLQPKSMTSCFEIYNQNCEVAFEEDNQTVRVVFPDDSKWDIFPFVISTNVEQWIPPKIHIAKKTTLQHSIEHFHIKPNVSVKQLKTGITQHFYGNVQVDYDDQGNNILASNGVSKLHVVTTGNLHKSEILHYNGPLSIVFNPITKSTLNIFPSTEYKMFFSIQLKK
jgi:hypothetical protein